MAIKKQDTNKAQEGGTEKVVHMPLVLRVKLNQYDTFGQNGKTHVWFTGEENDSGKKLLFKMFNISNDDLKKIEDGSVVDVAFDISNRKVDNGYQMQLVAYDLNVIE